MTQTVSIRLDDEVLASLDTLSKITDRSRAWLMGHAVEQYVQQQAWQVRGIEKTLTKVQAGHAQYVDHQEVSEWLYSWGTESEIKQPICK